MKICKRKESFKNNNNKFNSFVAYNFKTNCDRHKITLKIKFSDSSGGKA